MEYRCFIISHSANSTIVPPQVRGAEYLSRGSQLLSQEIQVELMTRPRTAAMYYFRGLCISPRYMARVLFIGLSARSNALRHLGM